MSTSPATARTSPRKKNPQRSRDPFLEPRRADCPWCGSARLRPRVRAGDPLRHRPGRFVLDQCRDCGHVFQNPRLTAEGVAFYHRDFYERHLEEFAGRLTPADDVQRRHRATARKLSALAEPESWLDVGTGHARFPEAAKEFFPYTSFDGLDWTARVQQAQLEERVEEAHRGYLTTPGTTARLRGRYDVVSMFRHLEHTPDPRAELRAALTVLRPGGHLVIEVADPHCGFAALLGRWWLPYGQPRHLHLLPLANLHAELEAQGCRILVTDRSAPHIPYDLSGAIALFSAPHAVLRFTTAPLLAAAAAIDYLLAPLLRHTHFSNTYRIVARKPPR
ncbi:class I SAM-dependent methyltransferase [Streptomyces alanosinicus]|uniref:Methyltransferase type 12 n=1 Tax=Streptomyces alanosinicus TaxID=68171 RepID=A0A919CZ16_9ACTN|nr:class I SAM-dependent methyltransferase [Streptomyces alanosinicus]GHD97993.1 methyltransferase type 12 [Streptomyces alanosinicus]